MAAGNGRLTESLCFPIRESPRLFDDSEKAHPMREEEYIKIEKIRGKLVLVGAEDDGLWDTAKYIRRMEERLSTKSHDCDCEILLYKHGRSISLVELILKKNRNSMKCIIVSGVVYTLYMSTIGLAVCHLFL